MKARPNFDSIAPSGCGFQPRKILALAVLERHTVAEKPQAVRRRSLIDRVQINKPFPVTLAGTAIIGVHVQNPQPVPQPEALPGVGRGAEAERVWQLRHSHPSVAVGSYRPTPYSHPGPRNGRRIHIHHHPRPSNCPDVRNIVTGNTRGHQGNGNSSAAQACGSLGVKLIKLRSRRCAVAVVSIKSGPTRSALSGDREP